MITCSGNFAKIDILTLDMIDLKYIDVNHHHINEAMSAIVFSQLRHVLKYFLPITDTDVSTLQWSIILECSICLFKEKQVAGGWWLLKIF